MRDLAPRIVTVAALAVAVGTSAWRGVREPGVRSAGTPAGAALQPTGPFQPTAANVGPTYHSRRMLLEARVTVDPADSAALRELADLLIDAHDAAGALAYRQRYVALVPESTQGWIDLAAAAAGAGDPELARTAIGSVLDRSPDNPVALYDMGALAANAGRIEEARDWWRKAERQTVDPQIAAAAAAALSRIGPR